MRIQLDVDKCEAFAACIVAAPEVFDFDDEENIAILLDDSPSTGLREKVKEAVRNCPVRAIELLDEH